jgi:hypothetical protein
MIVHKIYYSFDTKKFVGLFFSTHLFGYLFSIILNASIVDILLKCINIIDKSKILSSKYHPHMLIIY